MQISEQELEDFIYEDLTTNYGDELNDRGLSLIARYDEYQPKIKWFRQFDVGMYGRIDIVGVYRYRGNIFIDLIELKAVPIRSEDFDQICRYENAIKEYLNHTLKGDFPIYIFKYLIGTDISSGHYIHNVMRNTIVVVYNYGLEGICFDSHEGRWSKNCCDKFDLRKSIQNAQKVY